MSTDNSGRPAGTDVPPHSWSIIKFHNREEVYEHGRIDYQNERAHREQVL